jgi:hypothetical protein
MPFLSRPNSWVSQDAAPATQLTYALKLNPAPLTVSISGRDPILGSLEFVITNPTASPVSLHSVAFIIQVGRAGSNLTTTTANIRTSVSDSTNWFVKSPGTITSGEAMYTLTPQTGSSVSIAPGASVVVEIYNFPTVENPGNTTVTVKESAGSASITSFLVTTFPSGFYFSGLSATVTKGSQLVPVAQVATGSPVTLVWNSSVVDLTSFTIYYSNAAQGQQSVRPSNTGLWNSGPLSADTVFTIVVTVSISGGSPLSAALSTTVAVQNPSLIAASLVATTATVNGAFNVTGATRTNGITATGLTVTGPSTTVDLTASGTLNVTNNSSLSTVNIRQTTTTTPSLRIEGQYSSPALSIGGAGALSIDAPNVSGGRFTVQNNGNVGINRPAPGSTLDINGNLAVSSGANITGWVNMCPAQDNSKGVVGIGGQIYSNVKLMLTNNDPNSHALYVSSDPSKNGFWALWVRGGCMNNTGSWTRMSDLALKNRIKPYEDGLETVLKINPIRYHYKAELGLNASEEQVGVVAQDIQEIAPYMVGKGKIDPESNEEFLTLDNGAMIYMLVNAVKELHAEIEALKAESQTKKSK